MDSKDDSDMQLDPATEMAAPVTVPAAPVATVEHWAREKGMLAEFNLGQVDPGRLKRAPKSPPPRIHNKKYGAFAATRDSLKWDPTQWPVMTEAEFDAAVKQATAHAYH